MKISYNASSVQHTALLDELLPAVEQVFIRGDFILGEDVKIFESKFAKFHNKRFAIGVASGTDALSLSLTALGIGEGDEVITTANTFMTSISSIVIVGAKPILVDIAHDGNIDASLIEEKITAKTKAIMPVHLTGRPCQMDVICSIAKRYNLKIIEDCAQAISARFKNQLVGTFGELGCFSLHPFKTLNACGDAGVIITDNAELAEILQQLRFNGFSISKGHCLHWSANSRLDTIQAAILNVKFDHFEQWTRDRIGIAQYYYDQLKDISEIELPPLGDADYYSVYHSYIVRADYRDQLEQHLNKNGVETRVFYKIPPHRQPVAIQTLGVLTDLTNTEESSKRVLCLPIYPELTTEQILYITNLIKSFYEVKRKKNMSHVPFSYLDRQFSDIEAYLDDIRAFVKTSDFTLGAELEKFERTFAAIHHAPHAIGVGTGTDALSMSLKILGIGAGDEVITCANTFIASVGAIVQSGAIPVLVDSENGYVIDPNKIEAAITERTKAILPVHYTGNIADMPRIMEIANKHKLFVVEDACQAIMGKIDEKYVGSWGHMAAFSLHPLKNLNVWSDAGVIITHHDDYAAKLRLYRNHGLVDRETCVEFGINSRMDTLQAVIANRLITSLDSITQKRRAIASRYDQAFSELSEYIDIPVRRRGVSHVFHLYVLRVKQRNELLRYLIDAGIEAKIHYEIPMHLQPAARYLGYKKGDFPVAEHHGYVAITLPAHPYLTEDEITYTISKVKEFYQNTSNNKAAQCQKIESVIA